MTFSALHAILISMPGLLFYFLTFFAVYLATTASLDAVADRQCCCPALRRLTLRRCNLRRTLRAAVHRTIGTR